ncbi:3'-5' exonuclease [Actomonas aquatica]|uniref:3'-5' exonuclease n=1 Tax=Actomonas aquatica TaxID=2866162 RepID=A0ABZ1C2X5_9BACT|nr:3'-5' exonuclease [Opitutus sp. WL0086]WRQ85836.1 3'-5' exonuclease [Opitutus sp. WL0086]
MAEIDAAAVRAAHEAAMAAAPSDGTPVEAVRFVALDCETTGTDAKHDRIVTIGAVTVSDGEILLEEQFEALLQVSHNTSAVLVHGVTAEQAAEWGQSEAEAMVDLLGYLQGAVIVGHHIGFDVEVISRACERCLGFGLRNRWLDTMGLTLHLEDAGAFGPLLEASSSAPPFRDFSLDGLCRRFGVLPHDRHTASGDAFLTAQIFLKLLSLAKHHGRETLGAVAERWQAE